MASRQSLREPACIVIAEGSAEATLVDSLLEDSFPARNALTTQDDWQSTAAHGHAEVLVLAFGDIGAAMAFRDRFRNAAESAGARMPQVVLLCRPEEVSAAYDLCRRNEIFDYVMFWPVTHDPKRLSLAVHRASDTYIGTIGTLATRREPIVTAPQILVVDDDPFQRRLALSVVESAGYSAVGADSAEAALTQIAAAIPDLIVLDVEMPGTNGLELLDRLKSDARTAAIHVVMLTGAGQRNTVLEAGRRGATDFVIKPLNRNTLLERIGRILSARSMDSIS